MDRNRKGKGNYLPYTYKKKSSKGDMDGRLFTNELSRNTKNKIYIKAPYKSQKT